MPGTAGRWAASGRPRPAPPSGSWPRTGTPPDAATSTRASAIRRTNRGIGLPPSMRKLFAIARAARLAIRGRWTALEDRAVLHHELNVRQRGDVEQRVAVDDDDVGDLARL